MNETTTAEVSTRQRQLARRPELSNELAVRLTETSTRAAAAFSAACMDVGNVGAALDVAQAIEDMRIMFDDPAVKSRVVALQDTPLGFRTDHDPRQKNRKTQQPNVPYNWEVTRDCAIEGLLRGLQLVGNQFNIISYRCYCTREGFEFLIRRRKDVTEFRPIINVPASKPGGALVECEATWKQSGVEQSLKVTIPVKTDDYSGADQIIGKATRKFLARCYGMMTGNVLPEGDAGDADAAALPSVDAPKLIPPPAMDTPRRTRATILPATAAPVTTPTEPATTATATVVPEVLEPEAEGVQQNRLAAAVAGDGFTFDHFMRAAGGLNQLQGADENATAFLDLSSELCVRMLRSMTGLKRAMAVVKEGGAK